MIHTTAIIDPGAELAADVSVGPYTVIGPDVVVGAGSVIGPHVVINGPTRIGRDNRIYQFASIGEAPQDKKYAGEPTRLEIGDRNTIREFVTINRGTAQDEGVTRLGDDNWIMAYVHIAHDCRIGNQTIFANNASLAGHVTIGDSVILGGFTLVYQFCSIGAYSLTAYGSGVSLNIPPYVTVAGTPARPHGLNMEGLRRRGVPEATRKLLKQSYKTLYRENLSLQDAIKVLKDRVKDCPELEIFVTFLEQQKRGIVR
ncbi:MAG TPA: acyl-[acyl-carrier-protein]--UDP-N-acetylglucosamine O-acyltransferase [Gammaproteobacteria bacterium]|nr:acyl-[acyl-carrier-protein]--UDP-N-acetylglucosamine O-acyltransferase [Gammaproteobacteria bacterium]